VNPKNFFAELKRRNVYKVAIAYGVVAWLLMQVASQIFPFFEIPNWAVRLVVLLLIIGFPVALILAWAFELTPEGIKRAEDVDLTKSTARKTSHKLLWITAVVAIVAAALFVSGRFNLFRSKPAAARAVASDKSIAVLPFANLSRDPDNAYFAAGIQDEIITRLAKITQLKVISCTSTQRFKSAPDDLPAIAKELGVANIMEGSVQRSADQVRVNVQLIKAENDAHLWADTFDRKLTDIFKIETEIAKTIAETLRAKLTSSEQHAIAARPTENTEAYQLYLKGRFFWNKRTGEDLKKAAAYFNQAIAADPKYALAYVGLADAYVLMPFYGAGAPRDCYPKAKAAAKKALEIDDTLTEAHTSLAYVLHVSDLDFDGSTREFQRAIELNPNYATAHHWYGIELLASLGRFDEAIAEGKRGLELDPLSLPINGALGRIYYFARRYDEAIEQLRKTSEMDPGFYYAHWNLGSTLAAKGAIGEAIGEYQKARALNDDPLVLALLARAYAFSGNKMEAEKILDQLKELSKERYVSAYSFALVYLGLGNKEEALRRLQKGYQERGGDYLVYVKVEPLLDPLRGDPRFEELVQEVFAPKNASSP
jgi:TolB-like protein/Flp pilus assembly protein TadD